MDVDGFDRREMRDALALLAQVESRAAPLREAGLEALAPSVNGRIAVRAPASHRPLPIDVGSVAGPPDDSLSPIGADVVMVGRLSAGLLRLRAFYPTLGLTAVVNGRVRPLRRSRLLAGAAVQERLAGRGSIVVPEVLDRGRGLRDSWIVEQMLAGRRYPGTQWSDMVPALASGLTELWTVEPLTTEPVNRVVTSHVVDDIRALLRLPEAGSRSVSRLLRGVEALAHCHDRVLVGVCHGDPTWGNWLRLNDGRAALVDWELARRRVLGNDLMKLLLRLSDPVPVLDHMPTIGKRRGVVSYRDQTAAALSRWLAGWRRDRAVAERSGRQGPYADRIAHRLDLLEQLLA